MATQFSTNINFTDVNDAVSFVTYLQGQKGYNSARYKKEAPALNATIDLVCTQILANADPESTKAFMMAQFAPKTETVNPAPVIPGK